MDITMHPNFAKLVPRAQESKAVRKSLLKRYRWEVVRPVLLRHDRHVYDRAANKLLPAIGMPFKRFSPTVERLPLQLFENNVDDRVWKRYRCWAIARVTGRWPLCVLGRVQCPIVLQMCSGCRARDITICHALCECSATAALYKGWRYDGMRCGEGRTNTQGFLTALFRPETSRMEEVIDYVGAALLRCADVGQLLHTHDHADEGSASCETAGSGISEDDTSDD